MCLCTRFQSGYCFIDERGIPDGWSSPTDNCQACNSSLSLLQWSPVNTIGEYIILFNNFCFRVHITTSV